MGRGVLWATSRIVKPEKLSVEKLCEWYENEHIQEVLVLPGVPSAVRYEALQPQPSAETYSKEAPWLVVYEIPDIEYRNSDDIVGISTRNPPSKELIETVYNNARFDIRFYEEVQVVEGQNGEKGPPKFVISAALEPPSDAASIADFDKWYREEHLPMLSRIPGFLRSRRYEVVTANMLEQLNYTDVKETVPKYLALHEFSGDALPWKELEESVRTEWSKKVMGNLAKKEVGWYQLKRDYPESEWGHVGK